MPHHDLTRVNGERPLKELVADLGRDTGLLIRQEIALAKVELGDKVSRLGKGAATMAVGAFLTYAGALAILAALLLGLIAWGVAPWLAALLVGFAAAATGFAMINGGKQRLAHPDLVPRRASDTVRENVRWAKEQLT